MLDKIDYKHRILAPVYWNERMVSFQTRAINNNATPKYRACPKDREILHHKNILYGLQQYWKDRTGICVEGITDVWKLGLKAFATFGINYKPQQVTEMAKHFNRITIIFDDEPQAQEQAKKLASDLKIFGVASRIITIEGDPGSLSINQARKLTKEALKWE